LETIDVYLQMMISIRTKFGAFNIIK